jgi:hypothetical protein
MDKEEGVTSNSGKMKMRNFLIWFTWQHLVAITNADFSALGENS